MIEVLKQALEALEANDQLINGSGTNGGLVYCMDNYYSDCFDVDPINKQTDEAIAAIKEALAQRTWVGLTDVEIDYLLVSTVGENEETHISFARAIEAKLKERNT